MLINSTVYLHLFCPIFSTVSAAVSELAALQVADCHQTARKTLFKGHHKYYCTMQLECMQTIIDLPSSLLPLLGPLRGWSCCGAVTSEDTKKVHHAPLSECEWKLAQQFTFIFFASSQ